ncbi:DUF6588 family protein [Thalassobellus citreus]|uniref:DUF6588 family protein n=1 Tax=Thalassobellus citreus TaxID=3367752 RepID=UPI0037A3B332
MKKGMLLILCTIITHFIQAQELESILLAAKSDANKLTESYINPAIKGLIYGMNSGWYHTAKVHKKLGFDLSMGLNASIVPQKDEIINFARLGLTNISSSETTSPTVIASRNGATMFVNTTIETPFGKQDVTTSFKMPSGISKDLPLSAIPTPAVQLNLGLPYKLDVMLRFVPEVENDDVKGNLLGLGLKKELTSLLGSLDKLPLHVSLLAAYTSMEVNYKMNGVNIPGQNQRAAFQLDAFTAQAIASLNFPIINVYGGFGYTGGQATLNMLGTYNLEYNTSLPSPNNKVTTTITDPINLDFSTSGFKATIGARLSLGFFNIFGNYTIQEYSTISTGIAFSFR